jgi:hypothetical protein
MTKGTSTGADTIWVYRWEDDDAFNQAPGDPSDTTDKTFGANVTADAFDRSQNPERIYKPFSRAADTILEAQFDGSWGTDHVLSNTWWLQFIFGAPTVEGTSAPYTHTYELGNGNCPKTAHLIQETHHDSGEVTQTVYTGCFVSSIDVDVSTEDTVSVTLDGTYTDEEYYEDAANSPYGEVGTQPDIQYRPMHFGNSLFKFDRDDDGTAETLALVQDASISLEGNVEGERELGTRLIAVPSFLQFEPDISYTHLVDANIQEDEQTSSAYGSTASTTIQETMNDANDLAAELEFDAGTGTDNKLTFETTGAFPDSYSRDNVGSPEDALEDDVDRLAQDVTAIVESDQQNPP